MFLPMVVFVAVAGVVCLGPLVVYLFVLSRVNDRTRPVVVSGPWDLGGLLAGLSGFLIMGVVLAVLVVESNSRYMLRADWDSLQSAWAEERTRWVASAVGYVLLLSGAIGAAVLARSGTLSVYNADRADVEAVVGQSLSDLGFAAQREGTVWTDGKRLVRIDPTAAMKHVMIAFPIADARVREELERSLRVKLAAVDAPENLSSVWLTSAAVSGLILFLACVFVLGYFTYLTT